MITSTPAVIYLLPASSISTRTEFTPCLYERGEEDLSMGSEVLPRYGTTCVLPTLYTVMSRDKLHVIEQSCRRDFDRSAGAAMPGFHLEGPFLALAGAGGATIPAMWVYSTSYSPPPKVVCSLCRSAPMPKTLSRN